MDREIWQVIVHGLPESDMTQPLNHQDNRVQRLNVQSEGDNLSSKKFVHPEKGLTTTSSFHFFNNQQKSRFLCFNLKFATDNELWQVKQSISGQIFPVNCQFVTFDKNIEIKYETIKMVQMTVHGNSSYENGREGVD